MRVRSMVVLLVAVFGLAACKPSNGAASGATPGTAGVPGRTTTTAGTTEGTGTVGSTGASPRASTGTAGPSPAAVTQAAAPFFSTVPALPTLVSASLDGTVEQNSRVGGRDDGQSTLYGNRSVWIFADTTLKNPWGFLSNSGAATTDLNASDGITLTSDNAATVDAGKAPLNLIPHTAAETAFEAAHAKSTGCTAATDQYCGAIFGYWPGPVIADPARGRILVLFGKLCRGGAAGTPCSGSLGRGLGTGIAAVDMATGAVTRLTADNGPTVTSVEGVDRTMFFGPSDGYSSAALTDNGIAYLYGECTYHGCHLAKVALADLTNRADWTFWSSSHTWTTNQATGTDTIAPGAAGETVFYDPALKAWLNVYMPYGTNDVDYQVGGSPSGPWSGSHKAMSTPASSAHDYSLYGHPEYAQQNGLVQYLSYFHTDSGDQKLVKLVFKN